MDEKPAYTKEELQVILNLLNQAPTAGEESLRRLLELIEKTKRMISEAN